jgi:hypothetical protein
VSRALKHLFVSSWIWGAIGLLLAGASSAQGFDSAISQERGVSESFTHARVRHHAFFSDSSDSSSDSDDDAPDSAEKVATDWASLDSSEIPQWNSWQLRTGFQRLRDQRYLEMSTMPGFARRLSWLYPDDGCFSRAALATQLLAHEGYPHPKKLFAFGNLVAQTPNTSSGQVSWWYHTVPVVRVGGEVMALDPSIEPKRPLPFAEWVQRMGGSPQDFTFAVCQSGTYTPYSSCYAPPSEDVSAEMQDQDAFLQAEWAREQELGRDPVKELGDQPPWKASLGGSSAREADFARGFAFHEVQ